MNLFDLICNKILSWKLLHSKNLWSRVGVTVLWRRGQDRLAMCAVITVCDCFVFFRC